MMATLLRAWATSSHLAILVPDLEWDSWVTMQQNQRTRAVLAAEGRDPAGSPCTCVGSRDVGRAGRARAPAPRSPSPPGPAAPRGGCQGRSATERSHPGGRRAGSAPGRRAAGLVAHGSRSAGRPAPGQGVGHPGQVPRGWRHCPVPATATGTLTHLSQVRRRPGLCGRPRRPSCPAGPGRPSSRTCRLPGVAGSLGSSSALLCRVASAAAAAKFCVCVCFVFFFLTPASC